MSAFNRVLLRTPLALGLGSMAFIIGFYRLVVLSTTFTVRMLRGESPDQALTRRNTGRNR